MKLNKLLIYPAVFMLLMAAACRKDDKGVTPPVVEPVTPPKPYAITEDFESGVKPGYDVASVTTATGSWSLDGALLGTDANDTKDGKKSVRLQGTTANTSRNGIMTMNFDIKHLTSVSIKAALSNFSDKARGATATLKGYVEVQKSIDGGKTFTKIGATINCDTILTATKFTITDSVVRFRIVNTSDLNGTSRVRINIDDIEFDGTGDPGFIVGTVDTGGDTDPGGSTSTPAGARPIVIGADAPTGNRR